MKKLRILHCPINIAGIAGTLASGERNMGMNSYSYTFQTKSLLFQSDFQPKARSCLGKNIELFAYGIINIFRIDVFVFHFGQSLTTTYLLDVPILKFLGKKIFFYFHGCDIRDSKEVINKYPINACREHWPMACSLNRKKAIAIAKKYADGVFVTSPDLLEFVPGSIWLPQPIDCRIFSGLRKKNSYHQVKREFKKDEIVIMHAPSNRVIKGTKYLEQAVQDLKDKGYPVRLVLIENMEYKEALNNFLAADIVVDQLLIGAYGSFSVEMMALGKPVVCYIRKDLMNYYPSDLPIISADPNNLSNIIEGLIHNKNIWVDLGKKGIQYVEKFHNKNEIAKRTINYYNSASNLDLICEY